ncbi:MAG: ribulose-phosphate 3-epimerase [Muribaculaceae bacterium]|nr:ribulose-phosphate 3-epimerase [Muribaculaceae bacterium]
MKVSPSILAADFLHLEEQIEMLNESKASMIHIDVMDGVFVPNISIGFPVIEAVSRVAKKPLDVHLMTVDPQRYVNRLRDVGATFMNVHVEACTHLDRTIHEIKEAGMKAAVTLNPSTPLVMLEEILEEIDMVLLMTVNPGFGGQSFIKYSVSKIRNLKNKIRERGARALIEVDGGINSMTGRLVAEAGCDVIVAGSWVFNSNDPKGAIESLASL